MNNSNQLVFNMASKDKWVRRFSVDETAKHKNGFTIYKIVSVLFPLDSPEAVTSVSVWKRYSDVQTLHKSMFALHTGLHLKGIFPTLPRHSYFKRFQPEVIEERAKTIKTLLEFVAEHRLLFASTEFVNFLQTGYPEPEGQPEGLINAIRSSLHLPIEETPPLEYQTDDDDSRTPVHAGNTSEITTLGIDETDFISRIPIYEAADVEIRESPKNTPKTDSFESLSSIESLGSDLYEELNKLTVQKCGPSVKRAVLPDLINFDVPSTSKFEDYHTMPKNLNDSESVSLSSCDLGQRSCSKLSLYSKKSMPSLSNADSKSKTEDSYVFEAGYMLNLAARCEDMGDFQRAFECYKSGIEKMLIGVQTDSDPQRRALIKEKTNKYLSYAEDIYKKHLCNVEHIPFLQQDSRFYQYPIPMSMLKRPYEDLALYRVLAVLGTNMMLVMNSSDNKCYAMKVIKKVPNNLTEFDDYFLQKTSETRSPVLPTIIPYMVPLHAYIQTNNLIFLIISCAPGQKLFEYIRNYVKSVPTTPAREVNLENVFSEPKQKFDSENNVKIEGTSKKIDHSDDKIAGSDENYESTDYSNQNSLNFKIDVKGGTSKNFEGTDLSNKNLSFDSKSESLKEINENLDPSVDQLVLNSQKLLSNVDKVLSETVLPSIDNKVESESEVRTTRVIQIPPHPRGILPPSAITKWGAEIITALESLHNSGVICRDLSPKNLLLGEGGQITLTYFYSYPGVEMTLSLIRSHSTPNMYIAPELYIQTYIEDRICEEFVCDFWSFGAIMYRLICGVPLSHNHSTVFNSHTILYLPDDLSIEEQSLLTQLLTYEPSERLGSGKDGIEDIKRHPYFKNIDFQHIYDTWIVPD